MTEPAPTSTEERTVPCPDCKGAGCYDHAPVGSLLCPPCGGTGRVPAPRNPREKGQ